MKLIGVFPSAGLDQSRVEVFLQAMQQLGWSDSRNVRLDIRWGAGNPETNRKRAEETVALAPAIIVAYGSSAVAALLQATHSVPVVFAGVVDRLAPAMLRALARPGGNATGFLLFEYSVSGKMAGACCATAASGHVAAAPPISLMNFRRRMCPP